MPVSRSVELGRLLPPVLRDAVNLKTPQLMRNLARVVAARDEAVRGGVFAERWVSSWREGHGFDEWLDRPLSLLDGVSLPDGRIALREPVEQLLDLDRVDQVEIDRLVSNLSGSIGRRVVEENNVTEF